MNDHKFSNQKSALEDYFESLLSEDESEQQSQVVDTASTEATATNTVEATVIEAAAEVVNPVVDDQVDDNATIEPAAVEENHKIIIQRYLLLPEHSARNQVL